MNKKIPCNACGICLDEVYMHKNKNGKVYCTSCELLINSNEDLNRIKLGSIEQVNNRDETRIMGGFFRDSTCNRFGGSLEPLKNLTKLKTLNISNTHIKEGLEHLPNSVEDFYCLTDI